MGNIINVILCGGVGSRLWPLSRKSKPKQYLTLFEGKSLLKHTIERNRPLVDKTLIVGSVQNIELAEPCLKDLPYTLIVESLPRNTAAAIAFAAFSCKDDDILLVTPSDHMIENTMLYPKAIEEGIQYAQQGFMTTFGIRPTHPETGYGYIENDNNNVLSFREKPNEDTAKEFIKQGNFFWSSGILCFKANVCLTELKKAEPQLYHAAHKAFKASKNGVIDLKLSSQIPAKSLEYAVMERSKLIKVVPSEFAWSDMGSFDSLYTYLQATGTPIDEYGNMVIGDSRHVSFVGMRDTIYISTEDAVLILDKKMSQEVKTRYEELEKQNSPVVE